MALKYKENTTANYYVYMLESGNDVNDGLTPATAIKTCERAVAILDAVTTTKRRHVVSDRRKIYNESITTTRTAGKPITWEFLNKCYFPFGTNNVALVGILGDAIYNVKAEYNLIGSSSVAYSVYNSTFEADGSFQWNFGGSVIINARFTNCVFKDVRLSMFSREIFYNCVFINCRAFQTGSTYLNPRALINCVLSACTDWYVYTSIPNYFINCCIHGNVLLDGVTADNDDLQAAGRNPLGIGADPLFNDPTNNVYTVTSASPCLYAGTNNQHIGLGEAFYLNATTLLTDAVASSNVELSGGKLIRTDVDLDGYLETKVFHDGTNRIISMIDLGATLGYLNDVVIQSVELDAADASNPYVPFLTFKLKVGETEAACNASNWITLPFNQQPLVDEVGVGNGSEDIDVTDVWSPIKINYFKLYISITNPA